MTSAWPPPPPLYKLHAPGSPPDWPSPPPPPPLPVDSYTAFGVTRPVHLPPPVLHAPLAHAPSSPPGASLTSLATQLLACFTRLTGELAAGTPGFDATVHTVGVLLANAAHVVDCLRGPQAEAALEKELAARVARKRGALATLRAAREAAERAVKESKAKLAGTGGGGGGDG